MSRIVFISPYGDLSAAATAVAEELGIPMEFYEGWLEQAGPIMDQLGEPEVDVVISRGGTADYIAHHYDVPVILVNTSPFDIIECCYEAKKYSDHIAITSFAKPYIGLRLLEKVMGITITEVIFTKQEELDEKISALAEMSNCCVVGGGPSVVAAKRFGLFNVFLSTGKNTIRDALVRAMEMANLRRDERRKAYRLKTILDNIYDGIIAVDSQGKVEIINYSAERILGITGADVLGKDVKDAVLNTRLDEVIKTGEAEIGEIQTVGNVQIYANRIPIKDHHGLFGVVATFQDISRVIHAERKVRSNLTGKRFHAHFTFDNIIGNSSIICKTKKLAANYSQSDLTVLIYGPSGSGKELFAQSIHNASRRCGQPFVAVNCGALPPTLLESELFGYDEGAFTGAKRKGKLGLFELSHGGTIFLDEINTLPFELQGRLLRVLQEREVLRIGAEAVIPVDIRVIAATNQSPYQLLRERKIREDLFYRLNVLYLEIAPLAERSEDVPLLCASFLSASEKMKTTNLLNQIMPYLTAYSWPGNVRELNNVVQRLAFFADFLEEEPSAVEIPNILGERAETHDAEAADNLRSSLQVTEDELIIEALRDHGTIEKTAAHLGIGRSTLCRKLKRIRSENLLLKSKHF